MNKVEILTSEIYLAHHDGDTVSNADCRFFVTNKLAEGQISILPVGREFEIAQAFTFEKKHALRLAYKILEQAMVSEASKPLLERLDAAINT
jgi:hypothetical protein